MIQPIESSTLRILNSKGQTVGTGFLVSKTLAVTCAHVVSSTGLDAENRIRVQFTGQKQPIYARVPDEFLDLDHDVAILELESVPDGIQPLRLAPAASCRPGSDFRSFGYATAAEVQGIHANGQIDGYLSQHKLLQLQSPQANHGLSGAPVFDESRGVVVGMITKGHTELGRNAETTFATPCELLFEIRPEIRPSETCPYLGLETFTAETAQFFFGRNALTEKLFTILRGGCRFLAVFGPSGSGKSSVVRAGLMPKLEGGLFAGWKQVTLRPADDPFTQMKAAGLESLNNLTGRTILFIDQFEELFTLCPDELREKFIGELVAALENSRFMLVISMRDDFYSAFNAKAAPLAQSENLKIENVPGALKRDELIAMIERPSAIVGLALEEGLTELILKDLTLDGDARSSTLPLLEFALTQLWEQRRDGQLSHAAYQAIGGVTGSLARWADEAYSDLPKADQPLAESLLTSLVHLGDEAQGLPDTRRRRALAEFDEQTQRVIKHFADWRLLVTSGETVEFVHDALVREWGELQEWVKQNRDNLRLREGVSDDARRWENANRDESLLNHRGPRLELAMGMSKNPSCRLNPVEQDYLDACVGLREREKAATAKRRRYTIAGISAALVVIMAILVSWGWTSNENSKQLSYQVATATFAEGFSQQQAATADAAKVTAVGEANARATAQINAEQQAQIAQARELAASALSNLSTDPERSILLALESLNLIDLKGVALPEVVDALQQALQASRVQLTIPIFESQGLDTQNKNTSFDNWVNDVAFSPDGNFIAVARSDGKAQIRDAKFGKSIHEYEVHSGWWVHSVSFSPNGELLAATSGDNTVSIWKIATGERTNFYGHTSVVYSVAFSPDGKKIATASWDGTAKIWDINSGQVLFTSPKSNGQIMDVAFNSDGTRLAIASTNGIASILDTNSGLVILFVGHTAGINSIAFSPDGKKLVTASDDKTVLVWDVDSGKKETTITGHAESVRSVAFSSDGLHLITGSIDSTVKMWDLNGKCLITFVGHSNSVDSVIFSPDNKRLASASRDGTVKIWDAVIGHTSSVNSVAFSPDGKYFATGSDDKTVKLWDVTSGQEIHTFVENPNRVTHQNRVTSVAFTPDGTRLATAGDDQIIKFWDVKTGKLLASFNVGTSYNTVLVFSPDGKWLATAGSDMIAKIWDANTAQLIKEFRGHKGNINGITFTTNGSQLITSSDDKTTKKWDISSEAVMSEFDNGIMRDVAISPNSKWLVTADDNGQVKLWDDPTNLLIKVLLQHDNKVYSVAFDSSGTSLATASWDKTTKIWFFGDGKITDGKVQWTFHNTAEVYRVAFSPDGKRLATASVDGRVNIYLLEVRELMEFARTRISRSLTQEECEIYLHQQQCPVVP